MSELKWPSEEEVRKMFAKKEGFGSDATLSAAMELPEVRALVEALENIGHMGFDMPATLDLTDDAWRRRRTSLMQQSARTVLTPTSDKE